MTLRNRSAVAAVVFLLALPSWTPSRAQTAPPGTVIIPGNGGGVEVVPRPRRNRRIRQQYQPYGAQRNNYANRTQGRYPGAASQTARGRTRLPAGVPPEFVPGSVVSSAPVVGKNGLLYLASWNNKVYALDPKTGRARWGFAAGKMLNASPALGPDGTVYAASYDHKVYALDGQTGAKKWEFQTGDVVNSAPAVGPGGLVYVGGKDHGLYALDSATGQPKWQTKLGAAVSTPVVGADGTVYAGADGVYALDGATGKVRWSLNSVIDPESPVALGPDGTVYVGTHSGVLYAYDGATGGLKWQVKLPGSITYAPLITDDRVYVGADKLYALRTGSGRMLWQYGDGTAVWSTPVVANNGMLYASSGDESVYCLVGTTGRMLWKFDTGDPLLSFPALGPGGSVFIPSEAEGKVYSLNSRSGQTLWQFAQDPVPVTTTPPAAGAGRRRG